MLIFKSLNRKKKEKMGLKKQKQMTHKSILFKDVSKTMVFSSLKQMTY